MRIDVGVGGSSGAQSNNDQDWVHHLLVKVYFKRLSDEAGR